MSYTYTHWIGYTFIRHVSNILPKALSFWHTLLLVEIHVDPTSLGMRPTKLGMEPTYLVGLARISPNRRVCWKESIRERVTDNSHIYYSNSFMSDIILTKFAKFGSPIYFRSINQKLGIYPKEFNRKPQISQENSNQNCNSLRSAGNRHFHTYILNSA